MTVGELGAWLILPLLGMALYLVSARIDHRLARVLIQLVAFGIAEVGINQASYASYFGPVGENPGVFWLTSGLVIGVLLLVDRRHYAYFVLVSLLVHLYSAMVLNDLHWNIALFMVLANLTEQVLGSLLLRYLLGGPPDITHPRTFMYFCLVCVGLATAISAAIGSTAITIFYGHEQWFKNWQIWWFSNAMGMLSLGSAILAWNSPSPRAIGIRNKWANAEAYIVLGLLLVTTLVSVGPLKLQLESFLDYPYLVLPLLVWAALRLNARLAISAAMFVAVVTVFTANGILGQLPGVPDHEFGPFRANSTTVESAVLAIQAYLFVTLLTTQILVTLRYQQQRTEAERLNTRDQLYESQRMESLVHLASGVAHDLNNLLSVIGLYRDQVEERVGDDPSLAPALQAMDDATGNATAMSRSLLDLSRQDKIVAGPLSPRRLIQRTVQVCQPLLPVVIRMRVENELSADLLIQGDANQLQQVILNLILNARDAMMPGGGELTISARPAAHTDQLIEIAVADTGTGISQENLTRVLNPFFTTKPQGKGTGLGLSIVQSIIDAHGGKVQIDSAVGKGTTVRVFLPCDAKHPSDTGPIDPSLFNTPTTSSIHGSNRRSSRTALVYIENPQIRGAVVNELRDQGWQTQNCTKISDLLAQAQEAGQAHRPACAIVDLRPLAHPDAVIDAPASIPFILLCDHPPHRGLANPDLSILRTPFKIKDLVDMAGRIR